MVFNSADPGINKRDDGNFVFKLITPDNYDSVVKFMWDEFLDNAPISVALNYSANEPRSEVNDGIRSTLNGGLSFCALDRENQIAALMLIRIQRPSERVKDVSKLKNEALKMDILVEEHLSLPEVNLFEKYKVDAILDFSVLSVAKRYQRRGLGKKIVGIALDNVKKSGQFHLATCFCTAAGSQRIFPEFGFSVVQKSLLSDYKQINWSRPEFVALNEKFALYMVKHL